VTYLFTAIIIALRCTALHSFWSHATELKRKYLNLYVYIHPVDELRKEANVKAISAILHDIDQ
jgi:hypothetical protein